MSVRISHVVTCNEGIYLVFVFFEHHGALKHMGSSPLCSFLAPEAQAASLVTFQSFMLMAVVSEMFLYVT